MDKRRMMIILAVVVSLVAVPLVATAGPTTNHFSHEKISGGRNGDWSCPDGQKIDPVEHGDYDLDFGDFSGPVHIEVNSDKTITFDTGGPSFVVKTVLVKGGPNALLFNFGAGVQLAEVHAPENTRSKKDGDYYGVSNLCFLTDKIITS